MNRESFFIIVHKLTVASILTFLLSCSFIKGASYGECSNMGNYDDDKTMAFEGIGTVNSPSKAQLTYMETEAKLVMDRVLDILEKGKCYKALTDDIDENQQALEKWIKRTETSQVMIGLLLRSHPDIYCVSLRVYSSPVVKRNFKLINIMWLVSPNSNRCLVIVFPHGSCVSLYGAETLSERENVTAVEIRNIPSHFIMKARKGEYPNFLEETIEEENKKNILETIIDSHSLMSLPPKGTKGLLISFTQMVKHKGHRFWAGGIRIYSTYGYDASRDRNSQPECPKNVYGKPIGTCLTFPLPANLGKGS